MRPQSPPPLTLEEHGQLGLEIRAVRSKLEQLCALVRDVYGPLNMAGFAFRQAMESLEKLCADLEAQAAVDHPGQKVDGYYR